MNQTTNDVTREKLLEDFNTVISDTEQLLKSAASAGGDKANAWRAAVEQNLRSAKEKLADLEHAAAEKARATAQATDQYVHDKPWQAIGITAGVGVLVGLAVGMLLNRR